jgi:hypothetical protein
MNYKAIHYIRPITPPNRRSDSLGLRSPVAIAHDCDDVSAVDVGAAVKVTVAD